MAKHAETAVGIIELYDTITINTVTVVRPSSYDGVLQDATGKLLDIDNAYLQGVVGGGVHDHGEQHGLERPGALLLDGSFQGHAMVALVVLTNELRTRQAKRQDTAKDRTSKRQDAHKKQNKKRSNRDASRSRGGGDGGGGRGGGEGGGVNTQTMMISITRQPTNLGKPG